MRKVQSNSNLYKRNDIVAIGDSQTDLAASWGVTSGRTWTAALSRVLNDVGCITKPRVFAKSGRTTAQFIGYADLLFLYSTPAVGCIYGGVNDVAVTQTGVCPVGGAGVNGIYLKSVANGGVSDLNSFVGNNITITSGTGNGQTKKIIAFSYDSTNSRGVVTVDSNWATQPDNTSNYSIALPATAQIQANLQALIKILKFKCTGYGAGLGKGVAVWSQTMLPANCQPGARFVVMNDTSSTGGIAAFLNTHHVTLAFDYSASPKQTVWEYRLPLAGESGWGRVAIDGQAPFTDGVSKILVSTNNYLNWSAAGDNATAAYGAAAVGTTTSSQAVRTAAIAAVAAEAVAGDVVLLTDLYAYQSMLIHGGNYLGNTVNVQTAQGSNSWHAVNDNQHHNIYGHETKAAADYFTIKSKPAWLTSLSS